MKPKQYNPRDPFNLGNPFDRYARNTAAMTVLIMAGMAAYTRSDNAEALLLLGGIQGINSVFCTIVPFGLMYAVARFIPTNSEFIRHKVPHATAVLFPGIIAAIQFTSMIASLKPAG